MAVVAVLVAATPGNHRAMLHSKGALHPFYHVGVFLAMAWLASHSTRSVRLRVFLFVAITLLGCATEVMEWVLYHNPLEWTDMVLDAIGTITGIGLGALTAGSKVEVA